MAVPDKPQFQFDQLSAGVWDRSSIQNVVCAIICALLFVVYAAIYLPFLPNSYGRVGHDYSLHFPNLLTGYYWYLQNGLWATPWFSPSQCGGIPFFPDPNVVYMTITQLLVIAVSPMRAIQLTFLLFALIGMGGTFLLMRHSFQSSRTAAAVAAGLFLFNGFFAARMLIGHLTFHAIALLPLMMAAALPPPSTSRRSLWEFGVRIIVAGSCLAYMFESGMVQVIPAMLMSAAAVMLVHALCFGWRLSPWIIMACAGLLALALCAGRLYAELALVSNFPRDTYTLPGIAGLTETLWTLFQSLFLDLSGRRLEVTNTQWLQERHEWENGVSVAPLVIFALFAASLLFRKRPSMRDVLTPGRVLASVALIALLVTPIALNVYEPGWNAFLKELPYIRNSSSLLRFFTAYILILVVFAGLALDRIPLPARAAGYGRLALAAAVLVVMLWQNLTTDRAYYAAQRYDIDPIETEYHRVRATGDVPAIERIGGPADRPSYGPNDNMLKGQSQILCYQPLFGYRLEKFPRDPLQPGPVIAPVGSEAINLKHPACYLFPKENSCEPGDHFAVTAIDEAIAFTTYRPFEFERPWEQDLASWISIAAAAMVLAFLLAAAVRLPLRRRAPQPKP
jgi:hypothetical protein